jgi:tetraacyldisaccharide 4'-kinase
MKFLNMPLFWKKDNFFTFLLFPFSFIYFFFFQIRKLKQSLKIKKLKIKIICVGNINIGGTGKTPLTKLTYDILSKKFKCCTIKKYRSDHIDEINYLNKKTELISKEDRLDAILAAQKKGYQIAILDDGLQDHSFKTDLNIVCVKSNFGFGNNKILPSGPLREPLSKLKKCQIAVINGKPNIKLEGFIQNKNPNIKIFQSKYEIKNLNKFINTKFLAFSGIADNESFFKLLKQNDIQISATRRFPDHYHFTQNDIKELMNLANKDNAKLITTEKNYYNLSSDLNKAIQFIELQLNIKNYEKFLYEVI